MKAKKAVRVVLDIALSVMLVLEMLIQFTGEFLHEVIGFAFFATVVVHLLLSAAWVKSTARVARTGRLSGRSKALAVMGCLLAIALIALVTSSVAISNLLSSAGFVWPLGTYALWADIHTISAYAFSALVVVHLAMHWAFLASAMKIPYNPSRRRAISTGVNAVAAVGVVALGLTAVKAIAPQTAAATSTKTNPVFDNLSDVPENATSAANGTASSAQSSGAVSGASSSAQSSGASSHGERSSRKGGSAGSGSAETVRDNDGGSSSIAPSSDVERSDSDEQSMSTSDDLANAICTLCRKQCPLSAPRCNKPYEAGLI